MKKSRQDKINSNNNSSMAQNLDEVKELGKQMKKAKTGTELKEERNKTQDPQQ
ncbi:hypothetical protein J1P26_14765 [Neobacillus sp. MM2021_6]|uniref:hypothetical protein n=1 Tax=Bacillaceae TaxID=186817 RepID=UPI00140868BC|nr:MULTISPECIES: hypothetical protein [Bacillaceae]MBO0960961.1 hypothetical protein [Neobacillus sp. MM2021_6]